MSTEDCDSEAVVAGTDRQEMFSKLEKDLIEQVSISPLLQSTVKLSYNELNGTVNNNRDIVTTVKVYVLNQPFWTK